MTTSLDHHATVQWLILLALFLLNNVSSVHSSWWSLARVSPKSFRVKSDVPALCGNILMGLTKEQREICTNKPDLMVSAARGVKIAVKECKRLFAKSRWNCSTFERDSSVFGKLANKDHRETAIIYALTTAGVVYSVTKSCSSNDGGSNCSCSSKLKNSVSDFWWRGCDDDVTSGERFSRRFIDSRDRPNKDARAMMNLRNIEAGRRAVRKHIHTRCKCHGFSGTCSSKTCWQELRSFKEIGAYLKEKYDSASVMGISQDGRRLELVNKKLKNPSKSDLVYLEQSPDYCLPDIKQGILGTAGRKCNKSSMSVDSCDILCCGRGHDTVVVKKEKRCRCKFRWCCYVECQLCLKNAHVHRCKS